jgi:hypothetical protein
VTSRGGRGQREDWQRLLSHLARHFRDWKYWVQKEEVPAHHYIVFQSAKFVDELFICYTRVE